jgi:hypothetical protein
MNLIDYFIEVAVLRPVFAVIFFDLAITFSQSINGAVGILAVSGCLIAAIRLSKDLIFEVGELLDLF